MRCIRPLVSPDSGSHRTMPVYDSPQVPERPAPHQRLFFAAPVLSSKCGGTLAPQKTFLQGPTPIGPFSIFSLTHVVRQVYSHHYICRTEYPIRIGGRLAPRSRASKAAGSMLHGPILTRGKALREVGDIEQQYGASRADDFRFQHHRQSTNGIQAPDRARVVPICFNHR